MPRANSDTSSDKDNTSLTRIVRRKRKQNNMSSDSSDEDEPLTKIAQQKRCSYKKDLRAQIPQKCAICTFTAPTQFDLMVHNTKHIIIPLLKLQECETCSKFFDCSKKLDQHIIKEHIDISSFMSEVPSLMLNNLTQELIKDFGDLESLDSIVKEELEIIDNNAIIDEESLEECLDEIKVEDDSCVFDVFSHKSFPEVKHEKKKEKTDSDNNLVKPTKSRIIFEDDLLEDGILEDNDCFITNIETVNVTNNNANESMLNKHLIDSDIPNNSSHNSTISHEIPPSIDEPNSLLCNIIPFIQIPDTNQESNTINILNTAPNILPVNNMVINTNSVLNTNQSNIISENNMLVVSTPVLVVNPPPQSNFMKEVIPIDHIIDDLTKNDEEEFILPTIDEAPIIEDTLKTKFPNLEVEPENMLEFRIKIEPDKHNNINESRMKQIDLGNNKANAFGNNLEERIPNLITDTNKPESNIEESLLCHVIAKQSVEDLESKRKYLIVAENISEELQYRKSNFNSISYTELTLPILHGCRICKRIFINRYSCYMHETEHIRLKLVKVEYCKLCNRHVTQTLSKHFKFIHPKTFNVHQKRCRLCNKEFNVWEKHYKMYHQKTIKPKKCSNVERLINISKRLNFKFKFKEFR